MNKRHNTSCLVERMLYYVDLNNSDIVLLKELEKKEVSYRARTKIHFNDKQSNLFVVKSGWLYSYVDLNNKDRQVLRIHYPGDIVGLTDVAMQESFSEMMTTTDVVLCPFPKKCLEDIFTKSPRLTALIFSLGMLEQIILLDRLKMVSRSSAVNRLAHFILEVHARLKIHAQNKITPVFDFPMSQEIIGDAIGLTNVSVSNAFSQLSKENLITRQQKTISINNEDKLKLQLGFIDRYFKIDTSWFPPCR